MKLFTKIALVSAMAISANAMASQLQALDDETLSATTGQDGISIQISAPTSGSITIDKVNVHDTDGFGTATAGAITLGNHFDSANQVKVNLGAGTTIGVDIDAGKNGSNAATLNVAITLPSSFSIDTGDIGVQGSSGSAADYGTADSLVGTNTKILDTMNIALGGTTLNVQLGHEEQGAMIKLTGTIANGITISNLALNDDNGAPIANGGTETAGSLNIGTLKITDSGVTSLGLNSDIDIDATGLIIKDNSTTKKDIIITRLGLGDVAGPKIGDVEVLGLSTTGMGIRVSGK
ncbi:putative pilus system protein FilA [Acinetobacter populi]|uniref:DUF6160 domain-containing protein n=1 Tax=Acinetobacter populi TaxID=1582270 RepID=A0A1Z9YZX5_9GAMM|nr:DUF6160 family protein [Acinetobacter populi]OUY07759.1 hypothetical protein CAP51_08480 [Acinetobacter populi]